MGYSIAVRPRSPKLKAEILDFARRHFKSPGEMFGRDASYASELRSGDDLSYEHCKSYVGFDYKPVGEDDEYAHALIRWIAVRVGVRRNGVPVVRYDGHETWKVPPKWYDKHGWFTEQYKRDNPKSWWSWLFRLSHESAMQKMEKELHRLSALWEQEHAAER